MHETFRIKGTCNQLGPGFQQDEHHQKTQCEPGFTLRPVPWPLGHGSVHRGAEQAEHLVMPLGGERSVSGQGGPVQDLACRYRSLWLNLARPQRHDFKFNKTCRVA